MDRISLSQAQLRVLFDLYDHKPWVSAFALKAHLSTLSVLKEKGLVKERDVRLRGIVIMRLDKPIALTAKGWIEVPFNTRSKWRITPAGRKFMENN